jgi:hypothetical protein
MIPRSFNQLRSLAKWASFAAVALSAALVAGAAFLPSYVGADDQNDAFPSLRPGETMTGIYVMGGTVASDYRTVGYIDAQLNFVHRIANNDRYQVEIIQLKCQTGNPAGAHCLSQPTRNCPGLRQAAPGYLCIYEKHKDDKLLGLGGVYSPLDNGPIDRDGAVLWGKVDSSNSDDGDSPFSTGGWAITGLLRPPGR